MFELSRLHVNWISEAAQSASLGDRRSDKLRLGGFHVSRVFAGALRMRWPRSVTARLAPDGQQVTISGDGELAVLRDVFVDEESRCAATRA